MAFPGGSDGKASTYNVEDPGLIPGLERSPGEGNGNPLQYSCLENPMDRGAWLATVHGVTKKESEATSLSPSKAFEELEVKSTLPAATWWQNHIFNQDWQQV